MLMLSQNRINAVVSNCSVTLWAVDARGRFTFYKGKNAFLLGIDPEKRLGQNFFHVNAARPESAEAMARALRGESLEIESCFRDRIFETHMTPTYDERHEVNGVVGVYIDITERKRQEVELKRWEQYFQHSQCGMVIALSFSAIQQVNGAFAKIHGTEPEDWEGGAILDMYAEEFRPSVPEIMAKLESVGHLTFESVHVRKDGSTFPVLEDATAVKDEHGETLYCVISGIAHQIRQHLAEPYRIAADLPLLYLFAFQPQRVASLPRGEHPAQIDIFDDVVEREEDLLNIQSVGLNL